MLDHPLVLFIVLSLPLIILVVVITLSLCRPKGKQEKNPDNKTDETKSPENNLSVVDPNVEVSKAISGTNKKSDTLPEITNVYVKNEKLQTSEGCLVPFVGLIIVVLLVMIYFRLSSIQEFLQAPFEYRGEIRSH